MVRWLDHIEARGRAPKTLVENRRMAPAIAEELGAKDRVQDSRHHGDTTRGRHCFLVWRAPVPKVPGSSRE